MSSFALGCKNKTFMSTSIMKFDKTVWAQKWKTRPPLICYKRPAWL